MEAHRNPPIIRDWSPGLSGNRIVNELRNGKPDLETAQTVWLCRSVSRSVVGRTQNVRFSRQPDTRTGTVTSTFSNSIQFHLGGEQHRTVPSQLRPPLDWHLLWLCGPCLYMRMHPLRRWKHRRQLHPEQPGTLRILVKKAVRSKFHTIENHQEQSGVV